MNLDLECESDRIYITHEDGWKLGKIIKKETYINNSMLITLLNIKKEEFTVLLDTRIVNYIYYDTNNDIFIVSKINDLLNYSFWLLYIIYPE